MNWTEWRGSFDGRPAMWIKRLGRAFGWRLDLHKIVRADDRECFHTHPAYAVRIVLRGGYVEEIETAENVPRQYRARWPGHIGLIRPAFCHRVEHLIDGDSYSLWLRGPIVALVELRGAGWPMEKTNEPA